MFDKDLIKTLTPSVNLVLKLSKYYLPDIENFNKGVIN